MNYAYFRFTSYAESQTLEKMSLRVSTLKLPKQIQIVGIIGVQDGLLCEDFCNPEVEPFLKVDIDFMDFSRTLWLMIDPRKNLILPMPEVTYCENGGSFKLLKIKLDLRTKKMISKAYRAYKKFIPTPTLA